MKEHMHRPCHLPASTGFPMRRATFRLIVRQMSVGLFGSLTGKREKLTGNATKSVSKAGKSGSKSAELVSNLRKSMSIAAKLINNVKKPVSSSD